MLSKKGCVWSGRALKSDNQSEYFMVWDCRCQTRPFSKPLTFLLRLLSLCLQSFTFFCFTSKFIDSSETGGSWFQTEVEKGIVIAYPVTADCRLIWPLSWQILLALAGKLFKIKLASWDMRYRKKTSPADFSNVSSWLIVTLNSDIFSGTAYTLASKWTTAADRNFQACRSTS